MQTIAGIANPAREFLETFYAKGVEFDADWGDVDEEVLVKLGEAAASGDEALQSLVAPAVSSTHAHTPSRHENRRCRVVLLIRMKMPQLARAFLAAAFIFGTIPVLAITADEPTAMAVPFAQEPSPPQLSDEEQAALDAKKAGTLKDEQKAALRSAERKQQTKEKYEGERNQQKRDNNKRGGGRKR